jgi:uridine kinase
VSFFFWEPGPDLTSHDTDFGEANMIPDSTSRLEQARDEIAEHIRCLAARQSPVLVAIDGGSGAGKSQIASMVAGVFSVVLIPSDDFYASNISDAEWDRRTVSARVSDAIDWRRLRSQVLEPLLQGRYAEWHAFDFARGRPDGTYPLKTEASRREPAPVIVVEGAYSSRPELADIIHLSVLVDSPVDVRHRRLALREDAGFLRSWHARWDAAEEYYFSEVRPRMSFNLVVAN